MGVLFPVSFGTFLFLFILYNIYRHYADRDEDRRARLINSHVESLFKTCPDCAESIRVEAKICKHCGNRKGMFPDKSNKAKLEEFKGIDLDTADQLIGKYSRKNRRIGRKNHSSGEKSRIFAFFLALFLGYFGIHKFYLGYTKQGIIMLLGSLTFVFIYIIFIIALIEAISYIIKSDEEFKVVYVDNKSPWF